MNLFSEIKKQFPKMATQFTAKTIKQFINAKYEDLYLYHFGFGTWIRNHLLDDNSSLYQCFLDYGFSQKDAMSSLMIQLFYIHMKSHTKQKNAYPN